MRCFFMLSVYIRATVLSIENRKFRCFACRTCDFFNKLWQNVLTKAATDDILTVMIPVVMLYAVLRIYPIGRFRQIHTYPHLSVIRVHTP